MTLLEEIAEAFALSTCQQRHTRLSQMAQQRAMNACVASDLCEAARYIEELAMITPYRCEALRLAIRDSELNSTPIMPVCILIPPTSGAGKKGSMS